MCYSVKLFKSFALLLTIPFFLGTASAQWQQANVEDIALGPTNDQLGESAIALDDQGTLHVVYDRITGSDHDFYYKQKLYGSMFWSDPYPVGDPGAQISSPNLDVYKPSGVAYLVYLQDGLLKLGIANDCVWEYYDLQTPYLEQLIDPAITVDADGYAHVAFIVYQGGEYHLGYGYWEGPGSTDFHFQHLTMTQLGAFGSGADPDICVRSDGSVSICYRGGNYMMYQVDVVQNSSLGGTDWAVQNINMPGLECYPGTIESTPNDDLHLGFHGNMGFGFPNDAYYTLQSAGTSSWAPPVEVSGAYGCADPKLAMMANGDAHMVAMETSGNFYTGNLIYMTNQSGPWTSMYLMQGDAYDPSLIMDTQGNGNLVFKEYEGYQDHDVFYYGYVELEGPQPAVNVTLTPESMSIIIPLAGGSFDYTLEVESTIPLPMLFDCWIDIVPPTSLPPIEINQTEVTLEPYASRSRDLMQYVPDRAPGGTYWLRAFAGTYPNVIVDADSFLFGKLGFGGGSVDDDWFSEVVPEEAKPTSTRLKGAYPNPFNPGTTISYQLSADSRVDLAVHDVSGRLVTRLVHGYRNAGMHEVAFDASGLASGVYFIRMTAGDQVIQMEKLILLK